MILAPPASLLGWCEAGEQQIFCRHNVKKIFILAFVLSELSFQVLLQNFEQQW